MKFLLVFFENFIIITDVIADENNYAYIDNRNIYLGVRNLGWKLDFAKFRRYLLEKYSVKKAYMFIGYVEEHQDIYEDFEKQGYICVFKTTVVSEGKIKGNVDAELILKCALDINYFDKAVIITSDGDFGCLIEHLVSQNKIAKVIAVSSKNCSCLIKKLITPENNILEFLEYKDSQLSYTNEKGSAVGQNPKRT